MAIESYQHYHPALASDVFIADSADLIGRVTVGKLSSVWYNATLRGDLNEIIIGTHSNVQDNVVLHLSDDMPCIIGDHVTIGHSAIVHAATIKDGVLIGMGSIILDGSVIGQNSIVGAGSLVTANTFVPANSLVLGSPAKVVRQLTPKEQRTGRVLAEKYVHKSREFLAREKKS